MTGVTFVAAWTRSEGRNRLSSMRQGFRNPRRAFVCLILFTFCALLLFVSAQAKQAEIYIGRFQTNQVIVHIDTEGDRTYYLQYTDSLTLTSTGIVARWSNIFTVPAFLNHYVIVEPSTSAQRFYRLSVTP
jgi:hypothetical protein